MMKPARQRVPLLVSWVALTLMLLVFLAHAHDVMGENPDTDPRTYQSTIPILDEATLRQNRARADELERQAEERHAAALEEAKRHPERVPNKDPNAVVRSVRPDPTAVAAIREDLVALPGWGARYRIENAWRGNVRGVDTNVYAGVVSDNAKQPDGPGAFAITGVGQGILVVVPFPSEAQLKGRSVEPGGEYLTPTRSGPVRIIDARGFRLTLASTASDARFVFDLATRTWLTANQ